MQKRRLYLLLIWVAVVGVLVAAIVRSRDREPQYGGKRLSAWVEQLTLDGGFGSRITEADKAVRQIGTNALPLLLKWVAYEPPAWRVRLYELGGSILRTRKPPPPVGVGGVPTPNALWHDRQMLLAAGAARAFCVLGDQAAGARAELELMANDPKRSMSRVYVALAFHMQHLPLDSFPRSFGSKGGSNMFYYLVYQTNGLPMFGVWHTNPFVSAPTLGGGSSVLKGAGRDGR